MADVAIRENGCHLELVNKSKSRRFNHLGYEYQPALCKTSSSTGSEFIE